MITDAINSNPYAIGLIHDVENDGNIYYECITPFIFQELAKKAVQLNPASITSINKKYITLGMKTIYREYVEKVKKTNSNFQGAKL